MNRELEVLKLEITQENSKIAPCGCKYTERMKQFQIENFYPYCSCVIGYNYFLEKTKEVGDEGLTIPKSFMPNYIGETVPKNFILRKKPVYGIFIFEDYSNYDELQKISLQIKYLERLRHDYVNEDLRILNIPLSQIFISVLRMEIVNIQKRREQIIYASSVISQLILKLYDIRGNLEIEQEDRKFKEKMKNTFSRFNDRKITDRDYIILEFTDLTTEPTENQIKSRYKKLALKYHPDKNGDQEKFINVKNAFDRICKARNFS